MMHVKNFLILQEPSHKHKRPRCTQQHMTLHHNTLTSRGSCCKPEKHENAQRREMDKRCDNSAQNSPRCTPIMRTHTREPLQSKVACATVTRKLTRSHRSFSQGPWPPKTLTTSYHYRRRIDACLPDFKPQSLVSDNSLHRRCSEVCTAQVVPQRALSAPGCDSREPQGCQAPESVIAHGVSQRQPKQLFPNNTFRHAQSHSWLVSTLPSLSNTKHL